MFVRITRVACLGFIATAAMITLAPHSADALPSDFSGPLNYIGQENGARNVDYRRGAPPGDDVETGVSRAGAFTMEESTFGRFLAWCLDVDTDIIDASWTVNNTLLANSPPYLNPTSPGVDPAPATTALSRLQRLFDSSYDPTKLGTDSDGSDYSAAFQVAIWEVIYDDDFDVTETTSGFFRMQSVDADAEIRVRDDANDLLGDAFSYNGPQRWILTTLDSTTSQDLVTATAIPLPAAAWLLLAASGGLIAAKRRRAAKA